MTKLSFSSLRYEDLQAEPFSCYDFFHRLPTLQTTDLLLRPFLRRDARDVFAYASDPEVARYVLWDAHTQLRESREYIRSMRSLYRNGLPASWAITLRDSGQVIGSVGFMWVSGENHSAEVGYSLSRLHWGNGYATQALTAALHSAFDTLPLHRIEAQCDIRNPASARVMEKCGMQKEGILRGRLRNKGEYVDVLLYAIIRPDPSV